MSHATIPEEELQPLIQSMKKVFAPVRKMGPAIIKIPKELQRIGENLKKDIESGIPEKFEKACDKLEDMNEKFVMDFGDRILKMAKETRDNATKEAKTLIEQGIPAIVTETNEVKILNKEEILERQVKLVKTQELIAKKEQDKEKLTKEIQDGDVEAKDKLLKVVNDLNKLREVEEARSGGLGPMAPRRGEGGEEDYIPGPIREFGESLSDIVKGPFMAMQELGNNVKEFAKPFKALKNSMEKFAGDKEEDKNSPLGLLTFAFFGLGKVVRMIGTFFMITFLPIFLKVAAAVSVVVGAFTLIKTALELLIGGFTSAYNFFAKFVPNMDPIGTDDEVTVARENKRTGTTSGQMKTDEGLEAQHRIAQRDADVGKASGWEQDLYGRNKQQMADELKQQIDMRDRYKENFGNQGLMNIINNQTNSSTSVETKTTPSASNINPKAAITV